MIGSDLPSSQKILVICIDRDGDLEAKIGVIGPVVGREKIIEAATRLGLADPTESDTNVLFAGVKTAEELRGRFKEVEVAALTGSERVGVESDIIVSNQLEEVLRGFPAEGVVIVSDGAEDEHVLPIVESRAKVVSLQRVVVKQSEPLESTYYILLDFLKEVTSDPKIARLVLGVPGITFLLYMIFPDNVWRVIAGVFGLLLIIKGFNLEEPLERNVASLRESLVTDKASFFTYIIAALVAGVGILRGYQAVQDQVFGSLINTIPFFMSFAKDPLTAAGLLALAGRSIDAIIEGRGLGKYLTLSIFLISLWFIVGAVSSYSLQTITIAELVGRATIGAGLSVSAFLLRRAALRK